MKHIHGYFEGLRGQIASGWVTSLDRPEVSLVVQIEVDRLVVARIVADVPRIDVAANYPGALYCGFEFVVPTRYVDGKPHAIRVLTMGHLQIGPKICFQLRGADESENHALVSASNVDLVETHDSLPSDPSRLQMLFQHPANPVVRPSPWGELGESDEQVGGSAMQRQFRPFPNYSFIGTRQLINALHGICYTSTGEAYAITTYLRYEEVIASDSDVIRQGREDIPRLEGKYILFSTSLKDNYFHWHLDCLPAIHFLRRQLGPDWKPLCGSLTSWQADSLRLLGCDVIEHAGLCEVEHIAGAGYLDGRGIAPDSNVAEMFFFLKGRVTALSPDAEMDRKLFISRSDSSRRLMRNEDELWRVLERRGYRRLVLSGMAYIDQASLFLNADIVVAAHGAGLANLGYCRTGATIVEIVPRDYVNTCFRNLAIQCGLRHFWYAGGTGNAFSLDVEDFSNSLTKWEPA